MKLSSGSLPQRIKFRHLICFLEIARLKSVVKAADVLSLSQPAVSKTLHELEEILGVGLFDRSHRNVSLTRFGEVFLQYAGTSVTALRQGVDSIGQARASGQVIVKVGALPTASARVLPRAVKLFAEESLGSKTRIVTGPNAYLMGALRLGDVDFVIGRMAEPETMAGFSFEHLYSERVVFVARRDHPLLSIRPFDFAAISQYPVLTPPPGSVIRPLVERFLVTYGIGALRDEVETVSESFGRSYTRSSDAVWIISEGVVAEDVADGALTHLPLDTAQMLGPVGLTKRANIPLSLPAELLIQAIRDGARNL
ncbi:pca operon transcription factor PcaQ [Methylocella tundrae]|uniref:HTH-type transcriptional regulator PcaQ n=1 Tax=Methylocella tundrae TaxID=227605 RepID=A0A4U8Z816_METTU|nr:pca operon transcription factor PcaQ [Methylocella tundrae]WPP02948.1 pca operon transcription factor PcaQ [Methylocella tundrae]VFU16623.1 HTH-type transcriptional regulator PcaQ [Methylocella tundrae]